MMNNPIAVVISDIHFNINTLALASAALKAALSRAELLNIPLIIAGDLNDTKAIIRGEVANALIKILSTARVPVYILVGNHDLLNERGTEHGLNFLAPYAKIIDKITQPGINRGGKHTYLIPYQSDSQKIIDFIDSGIPKDSILIMHQGFLGAAMGDYIQDRSSLSPMLFKDLTVISGHYHRHQTITSTNEVKLSLDHQNKMRPCGTGTITYIGSPYTITFGEANDGPKGFLILNADGSFQREILNLRKHQIIEFHIDNLEDVDLLDQVNPHDLVWLKIRGSLSQLSKINKKDLGAKLLGHSNFKLDLIATESNKTEVKRTDSLTDSQLLDNIVDNIKDTQEQKSYLKELWRELVKS
jgi:DNA repair exonuclease SbcCD nuclease subunit